MLGAAFSDCTDSPKRDATIVPIKAGSLTMLKSTKSTAPSKLSISWCPTAIASVVLPMPPAPASAEAAFLLVLKSVLEVSAGSTGSHPIVGPITNAARPAPGPS